MDQFDLEKVTRDPPEGYLARIPLYVKGPQDARIQLYGSEGALYEIGILKYYYFI